MSEAIAVHRVQTTRDLEQLAPAWTDLLARCKYRDLFMTHGWITTWFHEFAPERERFVLRFIQGGKDIGIAPLRRSWTRWHGLPLRQIGFPLNGCSLQADLIFPERQEELLRALVGYLEEHAGSWDVVLLDGICADSGNLPALQAALPGSTLRASKPVTWESLVLPIAGGWEEFLAGRPRWLRKNLRVGARRLEGLGQVTRRCYSRPEHMELAMSAILDLERQSWKIRGGEAISRETGYVDFFRGLARAFSPQGAFQVRLIEVDGKPIAGNLVLEHDGTIYGTKTWYDERFAKVSPGRAVFRYMVEDVWNSGAREIYLDRRTAAYEQWTSRARRYHTIRLYNRRLYSRQLGWLRERLSRLRGSAPAPEDA